MDAMAREDWPRLLALLDEALERPADARAAWLQGLALPPALRSALQGLLAQRDRLEAQDFMAALPPIDWTAALAGGAFADGALVGPWRLVRVLGQGGMSVVWLAQRDDAALQRQVALKMPHAGPGQDLLARRMLRERRILASLEHPHIARLYDVGLTDAGVPYLVMEYVPGDNLMVHADRQRLTVLQRVQLMRQVLDAVQFAHGKLVLHRDLKPSNVLVDASGRVKLLDFGIAKMLVEDGAAGQESELTRRSGHGLTPRYASPEQLLGQEPGIASDVYSLGVILYELLCGQRPHDGGTDSAAALVAAVLHDDARPPSRQPPDAPAAEARATTPARLAAQLHGDLDAIVLKALARAPDQRYATAEALAADLRRWQDGLPVAAQAPGPAYYLGKFVRRHRLGVVLGSVAAVALVAAGTVAVVQGSAARQQAERAGAARDFLLELLAESSPERLAGAQLTAPEVLERGRQKAQSSLRGQPLLQAELLAGIGETQLQTREMASADAALALAAERFKALGRPTREATARLDRLDIALQDGQPHRLPDLLSALQPLIPVLEADRLLHLRWTMLRGLAEIAAPSDAGLGTLARSLALADERIPAHAAVLLRTRLLLASELSVRGDARAAAAQLLAAESLPLPATPYGLADRAARIAHARASLAMFADGFGTALQGLPASVAACDSGLGRASPLCGELRQLRLWALLRVGDGMQALALAEELRPTLKPGASKQERFAASHLWVRILAATGRTDRRHEAVAALEDLVADDRTDPLMPANALPALATLATLQLRAGDIAGAERWIAQADQVVAGLAPGVLAGQRSAIDQARGLALQARGAHAQALEAWATLCTTAGPGTVVQALNSLNCVPSLLATGQARQAVALLGAAASTLETRLGPDFPASRLSRGLQRQVQAPGYRPPPWSGAQILLSGIR